jgi:hypothetical protein
MRTRKGEGMKKPKREEQKRLLYIRKRSKRGSRVTKDERSFCYDMYDKYPEWYNKSEPRIFNETVPFGSNVVVDQEDGVWDI